MMFFCEKLFNIKYKMEDFKAAILDILKQVEQWKNYDQGLEKFEELFVEQQRKMLTINKNEDKCLFHWTLS